MLCFLQQGWQIGACRRGQLLTLAIKEEINTTQVRVSLKGLASMNNPGIFFWVALPPPNSVTLRTHLDFWLTYKI